MESKNGNTNFWISYADLMAGLLFVFILLIGAIIVKYSLLESESKKLEETLEEEHIALIKRDERIKAISLNLQKTKDELKSRLLENEKLKVNLDEKKSLIEQQKKDIEKKSVKLDNFLLSSNELKEKLKVLDENKKELLANINKLDDELKNKNSTIDEILTEKENLKVDLEKLSSLSKEKEEKLNKLLEEMILKEKLITSFEEKNQVLNDEMKVMTEQLKASKEQHTILSKSLESTKQKIKSFTGIRVKVISELKSKLGNSIEIDPKNGSLRLSSNILFDEGTYVLKESAKKALTVAVYDYFQTILENDDINKHVDKIVIEGHTNSKGNYLYNLQLSQKRAYSVMDFLLTLDFNKQEKLKELIAASGRSFLDPIFDENGKEDSNASRRIEIKLSLKNEQAIKEIANLLE